MVRLKDQSPLSASTGMRFQFHYGTIKSRVTCNTIQANLYFNSTMVRLKVSEDEIKGIDKNKFQFHYGTIKSAILYSKHPMDAISIPLWYD